MHSANQEPAIGEEQPSSAIQSTLPITATTSTAAKKLTLIPLIFLIYFEVAGGPYGEEPVVQAAGPLLALVGFVIFPFMWSVPEALITIELTTAFPGNGGFVIWAESAFGPFWGSLMGTWKFFSGVINIASIPVFCIDYVRKVFPLFGSGKPRFIAILCSTLTISFLNYIGLTIVGYVAVLLAVVSLLPFVLMSIVAIPKIHPHRWLNLGHEKKDWNLFFNTLFWNLNSWDNISTLAGEVDRPQKTFPVALLVAGIFICVSYLIPLLAVTGSIDVDQSKWETGFHAQAAEMIAGKWLKIWMEIGAVLSAIGLMEAHLSSSAYQILGMAERGILPKSFAIRSKSFNTPWVGILLSTLIVIPISYMNLTNIVSSANFLYSLSMLLEYASFLWLRWKLPMMNRPYRVPLKLPILVLMCLISSGFLIFIMVTATKIVYLVSSVMTIVGIGLFFFIKLCKTKNYVELNNVAYDRLEGEILMCSESQKTVL